MKTYAGVLHKWRETTFAQFTWGNLTPETLYNSFDAFCAEHGLATISFDAFQMQAEKECALLRIALRPVMHELYANSGAVPIEFEETISIVEMMYPDKQFRISRMD